MKNHFFHSLGTTHSNLTRIFFSSCGGSSSETVLASTFQLCILALAWATFGRRSHHFQSPEIKVNSRLSQNRKNLILGAALVDHSSISWKHSNPRKTTEHVHVTPNILSLPFNPFSLEWQPVKEEMERGFLESLGSVPTGLWLGTGGL